MPLDPERMQEYQMVHLNGNSLCAIWIETTGDDPRRCDIVEICIYLLDNFFRLSPTIVPYYQMIKPHRVENVNFDECTINREKLRNATMNGVDPLMAADRLEEWMRELNMRDGKRIVPLAYNWPRVSYYLHTWLGHHNFNYIFSHEYRDIMAAALVINDRSNQHAEEIQYPRPEHIAYIASKCKVPFTIRSDVMEKCIKLADIYKWMLTHRTSTFPSQAG